MRGEREPLKDERPRLASTQCIYTVVVLLLERRFICIGANLHFKLRSLYNQGVYLKAFAMQ